MLTMEDYMNFVVYYAPLVFGDLLLYQNIHKEDAWQHPRRAVLHYTRGMVTSDAHLTGTEVSQARVAAKDHLWVHAGGSWKRRAQPICWHSTCAWLWCA